MCSIKQYNCANRKSTLVEMPISVPISKYTPVPISTSTPIHISVIYLFLEYILQQYTPIHTHISTSTLLDYIKKKLIGVLVCAHVIINNAMCSVSPDWP